MESLFYRSMSSQEYIKSHQFFLKQHDLKISYPDSFPLFDTRPSLYTERGLLLQKTR